MGATFSHLRRRKEQKGHVLCSKSSQYQMEKLLGKGSYGEVFYCIKLDSMEKVAVKIIKKDFFHVGVREVNMLKELKQLDQKKNNLVRFIEHFKSRGHVCLVFEILDMTIMDYMRNQNKTMNLSEIRVVTQQMLVALNALKNIGLVHADIKPDNIMLVSQQLQPLKVKLIDFGMASSVSSVGGRNPIQALGYRAPEVILGLPLNEALDMWALGCVVAFMYIGKHLYPLQCEYEVMRFIVQIQGQPDDELLDSGLKTTNFFKKKQESPTISWKLKTQTEHMNTKECTASQRKGTFDHLTSLDDIAKKDMTNVFESEDTQAFLSLFKRMLHANPKKRITPCDALGHRFITMKHLSSATSYRSSAISMIKESKLNEFSTVRFITSSEVVSFKGLPAADLVEASTKSSNGRCLLNSHSYDRRRFNKFKLISGIFKSVSPCIASSKNVCCM